MTKRNEKFWLTGFAIVAVALGAWGYARAGLDFTGVGPWTIDPHHPPNVIDCIISSIGMIRFYNLYFPDKGPWQLVIAQVAIPGIALFSAARLLLTSIRKGMRGALARRRSGHAIVCGLGDAGMQVVQNLADAGIEVVAVDKSADSPNIATLEQAQIPVVRGDAKNLAVLQAAGLRRAASIVLTTGSDGENLEIASMLESSGLLHREGLRQPLRVLAEIRTEWMHKRLTASPRTGARISLFNPFTETARTLLNHLRVPPSPEFEALTFVVVGFGLYNREAALQLVRAYPVPLGRRLRVLVFDSDASELGAQFLRTAPAAAKLADFAFIPAVIAAGAADLSTIVTPALRAAGPLLGVSLAMGDDDVSLCAAMEMRSLLDELEHFHAPVYVRLEHYGEVGKLLCRIEEVGGMHHRLQVFGTLEETLSPGLLLGTRSEAFAEALHEDYRRRSSTNPQANQPWSDLPESWRASNRARADHTPLMMELAGLHVRSAVPSPVALDLTPAEIETLAQLEHRRYTIERQLSAQGAIEQRKPIPAPWEDLPESEREFNRAEVTRLPAFMANLGMQIERVRTLRLYGDHLADARNTANGPTGNDQLNLIVDLDNDQAVTLAYADLQASHEHSRVWILSRRLPGDFDRVDPKGPEAARVHLVQQARGWRRQS